MGELHSRWDDLSAFVGGWYRDPLEEDSGPALAERMRAAEARLGHPLPEALREWFRLVDGRLRSVQDELPGLDSLRCADGWLPILIDSFHNWFFAIDPGHAAPDPPVSFNGVVEAFPSLSGFLTTAARWQTVLFSGLELISHGASGGEPPLGPLGPLAEQVRGLELLPASATLPSDGLQLLADLPLVDSRLRLSAHARGDTLILHHFDADQPPLLLLTSVATRTRAAWDALQRDINDCQETRRWKPTAPADEAPPEGERARAAQDAALVEALAALGDQLLRFERVLLEDLRAALRGGGLSAGQRKRVGRLLEDRA